MPMQYASKIKFIRQKDTGHVIDSEPHLSCMCKTSILFAPLIIGCLCLHWLFGFSILHSNKTVNMITY